jgi:hypothetical protein
MTEQSERTPQEELLLVIDGEWRNYVPYLHAMSDDVRSRYVQEQGFANLKDLLVHIGGWWRAALEAVQAIRTGNRYVPTWETDAEFEQRGIEAYREVSLEQVERELEDTRSEVSRVIQSLSTEEINNREIYLWLYRTVVQQYDEHILP